MNPLVTVIVPTTHERKSYNEAILNNFIQQDYLSKHIIFDYREGTIGEKRNRLCHKAVGDIIVHGDSDDLYAKNWITKSVEALLESEADIVGLSKCHFYDPIQDRAYEYNHAGNPTSYLVGATLCYRKSFWERNPFADFQVGEDALFCTGSVGRRATLFNHGYQEGFLASIHPNNTSPRVLDNAINYRMCSEEEKEVIVKRFFGSRVQSND